MGKFKTPQLVKDATYSDWWFEPAWRQMWCSNAGNNMGVVVGSNGSGKTYLEGWVAEQLGVDQFNQRTKFNTDALDEHVFFETKPFINQCNRLMRMGKRKTIGTQLIIDEGQLALYSKDAFTQDVKNLSRMLMTIRSRRWGVYINLPSFGMLNRDVRLITNWMVQMKGKPGEYSYGTFYNVETNMVTGEPYLKKPVFSTKEYTSDGVPLLKNVAYSILPFPKPSKNFIRPYEKMKAIHQQELYEKYGDVVNESVAKEEPISNESVESLAVKVLNNKEQLSYRGKFSQPKVASFLGIGRGTKQLGLLFDYLGRVCKP